jgi:hypothetical protein
VAKLELLEANDVDATASQPIRGRGTQTPQSDDRNICHASTLTAGTANLNGRAGF